MLAQVREVLVDNPVASITDIAAKLQTNPDVARSMVDVWVRKGRVARVEVACGTCTECGSDATELYQWVVNSPVLVITPSTVGADPTRCEL